MDTVDKSLSERIEELEIRSAFQEDLLRDLDEVMRAQADQIDRLQRELISLREQLTQEGEGSNAIEDEKPPHY